MKEDIFDELVTLEMFNETTRLCIYPPKKTLYIIKRVPAELKDVYIRISKVDNPNMARVHIIRTVEDSAFIVRDFISGETLSDVLASGTVFSEKKAARIVSDVCVGLKGLHSAGIVHRDINPNNIIITPTGNACIIDYGIARSFRKEKSSDTFIMGTPGYAAPEQFGFTQSTDRTDIYAVGVLLNVLLTGKHPIEQTADGGLGRVVKKCIQVDQRRRYRNTDMIIKELGKYIGDERSYDSSAWYVRLMLQLPGLRSEKIWKKIVCIPLYYVFFAGWLAFLSGPLLNDSPFRKYDSPVYAILIGIVISTFMWLIPWTLLSNFAYIRDRLPFFRSMPNWAQIMVSLYISFFLLIFTVLVFTK